MLGHLEMAIFQKLSKTLIIEDFWRESFKIVSFVELFFEKIYNLNSCQTLKKIPRTKFSQNYEMIFLHYKTLAANLVGVLRHTFMTLDDFKKLPFFDNFSNQFSCFRPV